MRSRHCCIIPKFKTHAPQSLTLRLLFRYFLIVWRSLLICVARTAIVADLISRDPCKWSAASCALSARSGNRRTLSANMSPGTMRCAKKCASVIWRAAFAPFFEYLCFCFDFFSGCLTLSAWDRLFEAFPCSFCSRARPCSGSVAGAFCLG